MSDTLAFILEAPLQSWGAASKFQRRDSENWPTKSGVLGLLAAALGIDKHSPDEAKRLRPFAALVFSVLRRPKASPLLRLPDFHTIGGGHDRSTPAGKLSIPAKAGDGSPFGTVVTRRTYLLDGSFVALLQGPPPLLEEAAAALENPVWGVWLGRKSCVPSRPLGPAPGITAAAALEALSLRHGLPAEAFQGLEGMTETPGDGVFHQMDQPVAYGLHHGAVPSAYLSRPVRRLAAGELP